MKDEKRIDAGDVVRSGMTASYVASNDFSLRYDDRASSGEQQKVSADDSGRCRSESFDA